MEKNEGNLDRMIRVLLGLALIAYALLMPTASLAVIAWIGVIPLVTGLIGWCPIYRIFGMNTCPMKN